MKSFLLAATVATVSACAAPAFAQKCAPREAVENLLVNTHGELRQSSGLVSNGQALMETWANSETGTWTITITNPKGVTCLVGSGHGFASR